MFGWPVAVVSGVLVIALHDSEPGAMLSSAAAAKRLPQVTRDPALPTLMLFIHPRCPCSAASLDSLSQLLSEHPGSVKPVVVVFSPPSPPTGWADSAVTRLAASLPGVTVLPDYNGVIARAAGVRTSGHVMLLDTAGRLLFNGGITVARGHVGHSIGMDAISRALSGSRQRLGVPAAAPVFGCSFDPADAAGLSVLPW